MIACPVCKSLLDEMGHDKVRCPFCGTVIETELIKGKPRAAQQETRYGSPGSASGKGKEDPAKGLHEGTPISLQDEDEQFVPRTYIAPMGLPATEEIIYAGLSRRFLAWFIDILIISLLTFPLIYFGLGLSSMEELVELYLDDSLSREKLTIIMISTLVHIPYFVIFEAKKQQSIGKIVLDIVVVKEDITAVKLRDSILRNVPRFIYELPYVGIFMYIIDAFLIQTSRRRFGDTIARTFVVEKDYYDFKRQGLRLPDTEVGISDQQV